MDVRLEQYTGIAEKRSMLRSRIDYMAGRAHGSLQEFAHVTANESPDVAVSLPRVEAVAEPLIEIVTLINSLRESTDALIRFRTIMRLNNNPPIPDEETSLAI